MKLFIVSSIDFQAYKRNLTKIKIKNNLIEKYVVTFSIISFLFLLIITKKIVYIFSWKRDRR